MRKRRRRKRSLWRNELTVVKFPNIVYRTIEGCARSHTRNSEELHKYKTQSQRQVPCSIPFGESIFHHYRKELQSINRRMQWFR